jgi:hypothetical protein
VINWGILEPNSQTSFTFYVRNEGNVPVTLAMTTANWNPSAASTYMVLTWNYADQKINAGENIAVTVTLSVSGNIVGINDFSFNVVIVATG